MQGYLCQCKNFYYIDDVAISDTCNFCNLTKKVIPCYDNLVLRLTEKTLKWSLGDDEGLCDIFDEYWKETICTDDNKIVKKKFEKIWKEAGCKGEFAILGSNYKVRSYLDWIKLVGLHNQYDNLKNDIMLYDNLVLRLTKKQ